MDAVASSGNAPDGSPDAGDPQESCVAEKPNPEHDAALARLFERLGELSSLPGAASRVLQVASDETAGAVELLEVVEGDPSLALRIMRTVNSSYYGLKNTVADLRSAISLLGFREVRNLALTVYVSRLFEQPGVYRMFDREKLWNHMVAVGTTARMVSKSCNKAVPDEAYLAGLLHDVGMILIDQFMRRHFVKVLDLVAEGKDTMTAEREVLSFDHVALGAFIARRSHFPEEVVDSIAYHHHAHEYEGPNTELVYVVAVANYLASREGVTSLGIHKVEAPDARVFSTLGIHKDDLSEIWNRLTETLVAADQLVAI